MALLFSEQSVSVMTGRAPAGQITPLEPAGAIEVGTLQACNHIVAPMGPEPYVQALEAGAEIILGDRTTNTAMLAAVPLMRGAGCPSRLARGQDRRMRWPVHRESPHCGRDDPNRRALVHRRAARDRHRCSPYTRSAYMLYESVDPFRLTEPGGVLDVTAARYRQVEDRTVRFEGSSFEPRLIR